MRMTETHLNLIKTFKMEGQLYKYTNVVRGFQIRYFVVNNENAKLDYFMSEEMKAQRPRGCIDLQGAVISPSEEDSTTFTIHTPLNEMVKLRASDAKERQHWVNILRLVSENAKQANNNNNNNNINNNNNNNVTNESSKMDAVLQDANQSQTNHINMKNIIENCAQLPQPLPASTIYNNNNNNPSSTSSSTHSSRIATVVEPASSRSRPASEHRTFSTTTTTTNNTTSINSKNNNNNNTTQIGEMKHSFRNYPHNNLSNEDLVKEIFFHVKSTQQRLDNLINELPRRGSKLSKYDKDLLLLKASATSCVNSIAECCQILKLHNE